MLNLIINEYAKIFHKKSTYALLILLLLSIIGLPIGSKIIRSFNEDMFLPTYEDEINWAKSDNNDIHLALLEKAQSIGLSVSQLYSDNNWRTDALNDLYYTYWASFNSDELEIEADVKKQHEELFNEGIQYVEKNDWKNYFKFKIRIIDADTNLEDIDKKYEKYQYEYMLEHNIDPNEESWHKEALFTYTNSAASYEHLKSLKDAGKPYDEMTFSTAEKNVLISKYRLENNQDAVIYTNSDEDIYFATHTYTGEFYNNLKNSVNILMIVLLISIIIAGGIISSEFSQGTIKFLLINPVKRSKIFWSKYLTVFSYAFILTVTTFILEFIMSIIVFGSGELDTTFLSVVDGKIIEHSALLFMITRFLLSFVQIWVAFTIAFMISSLFRNLALATAVSMIVYFVSSVVCEICALLNIDFFRYSIFGVIDLTSIVDGKSLFLHLTPGFAVGVILVHMVLLLLTAYDSFTKKNI